MSKPIYTDDRTEDIFSKINHNLTEIATDGEINKRILQKYCTMSYLFDFDSYGATSNELNRVVIQNVADEWHDQMLHLLATTKYDYNPINNYDMTEIEGIDNCGCERTESESNSNSNGKTSGNNNGDSKTNNFGYNSSNPTAVESTSDSDSTETKTKNSQQTNDSARRRHKDLTNRELKRSGNIGVTTTQQMIQSERDIIIDVLDEYINKFISCFKWGVL